MCFQVHTMEDALDSGMTIGGDPITYRYLRYEHNLDETSGKLRERFEECYPLNECLEKAAMNRYFSHPRSIYWSECLKVHVKSFAGASL